MKQKSLTLQEATKKQPGKCELYSLFRTPHSTTPTSQHHTPMERERESSSSKKRKISTHQQDSHQDDESDDEEKMDKFFALIKSVRDSRHRLMNGSDASADTGDGGDDRKKRKVVWKPSFQREDFMEEAQQSKDDPPVTLAAGSSQRGDFMEEARQLKDDPPMTLAAAGSFQREDFRDEARQLKGDPPVTLAAGQAGNIDERQKEETKEVIDLSLSL